MLPDARRRFLRFLASSPIFAASIAAGDDYPPPKSAGEALNVSEFEPLAQKNITPAHWGYLATGVSGDRTLRRNCEAMDQYQLRVRLFSRNGGGGGGASSRVLQTQVLGETWDCPFYLSAVASQQAFHPDGEAAVARATRKEKVAQMLSINTSISVEKVAQERGGAAPWFQLYMPPDWAETEKLLRRVEAAGCKVLVWTVDTLHGRWAETGARAVRLDSRACASCHGANHPVNGTDGAARNRRKPMYDGLSGRNNPGAAADWSYVGKLKKLTSMKVVVKGIDTTEDAVLARENGADAIVVSNHGGRGTETGRGTMDILPEVIDALGGPGRDFPVLIDGGFRRGTDIFKALAIGAKAVGIGRPYIWGLGAFGQEGVERVIQLLRTELELTIRQVGFGSVSQIDRSAVLRNGGRLR
jgi:4-hydroxymandelate oxidase